MKKLILLAMISIAIIGVCGCIEYNQNFADNFSKQMDQNLGIIPTPTPIPNDPTSKAIAQITQFTGNITPLITDFEFKPAWATGCIYTYHFQFNQTHIAEVVLRDGNDIIIVIVDGQAKYTV